MATNNQKWSILGRLENIQGRTYTQVCERAIYSRSNIIDLHLCRYFVPIRQWTKFFDHNRHNKNYNFSFLKNVDLNNRYRVNFYKNDKKVSIYKGLNGLSLY